MNRLPFKHRSSQVLALFRILLASLFGLWVWLYLEQPVFGGQATYLAILAYLAYGVGLYAVAKHDWWLDFHLALPTFVIDIMVYLAALQATQAATFDFISPFITFFAFLMVSAAVRWNHRILPFVAAVLGGSFLIAGLFLQSSGVDIDVVKFVMRCSYLGALSLILMWFALNRSPYQVPRLVRKPDATPYADALAFAMRTSGAAGAVLIWADNDNPRHLFHFSGDLSRHGVDQPQVTVDVSACDSPMLFDAARARTLKRNPDGRLAAGRLGAERALLCQLALVEGVMIPLRSSTGKGHLILSGIRDLCWDDIMIGNSIAREMEQGLDEEVRGALAREMAVNRVRTSLARDLHDSVAQSLAGTRYRLDSMREMVREGKDVLADLDSVSDGLRREQEQIRAVIDQLRRGDPSKGRFDLRVELSELARVLAENWQIEVVVADAGSPVAVPQALGYEFQQIMREAVANAVRHGAARHVDLKIDRAGSKGVNLVISDDGSGFGQSVNPALPRSISERVAAIGGTMALTSASSPTRIEITIPAKVEP